MASRSRRIQNAAGAANSFLNAVDKPNAAETKVAKAVAASGKSEKMVSAMLAAVKQMLDDSDVYQKRLDSKSIDVTLGRIASLLDEAKEQFVKNELDAMKTEILDAISGFTASGVLKTFLLSQLTTLFDSDAKKEDIEELKQWLSENFQAKDSTQEESSVKDEFSLDQVIANKSEDEKEGDYQDSTPAKNFMTLQNAVNEQIDKLNQNLKTIPGQSGILSKISSSVSSSFNRITNRISKVSKGILSIFSKVGTISKLIGTFTLGGIFTAIAGLTKGIGSVIKGIGSLGKGIITGIGGLGKKIGGAIASPFKKIGGFFSAMNPFKRSEQKREERKQKAKDKIMEVMAKVIDKIWKMIQPFMGIVMPFLAIAAAAIIAPIALLVLKVLFIVSVITALIAGAVLLVLWIKKKFNWVGKIWDEICNVWNKTIWPWISNAWNTIVTTWNQLSDLWNNTLQPWLCNLWDSAVSIWNGICSWIENIKFKIQYWIATIQLWWIKIQSWIAIAKKWIAKISDWISTIVDTITLVWNWITDPNTWINLGKKLLELILDAFKFILIDLPIYLFVTLPVKFGLMVGEMIGKGVRWIIEKTIEGIALVIDGIVALGKSIWNGIKKLGASIANLGKVIWQKLMSFGNWLYSTFIYPWIVSPLQQLKQKIVELLLKLSEFSIKLPVGISITRHHIWKWDIPIPSGIKWDTFKPFGSLASALGNAETAMPTPPNASQMQEAAASQVQNAAQPIRQLESMKSTEGTELAKSGEEVSNVFEQKEKEQQQFNQDQSSTLNAIRNELNVFKSEALKKLDDPAAVPVPIPVNSQQNSAMMRRN